MDLAGIHWVIVGGESGNNVGKYHACYIVNAIVNMMGLTDEDFDNFHKKFARFKEGRSGDDESTYNG